MIDEKKYYKYPNKKFIIVEGQDKNDFLQGLISNDLKKIEKNKGIYSSLLTPQGKILFDFFVSDSKKNFLIECSDKVSNELIKKLSIYKLRSNININIIKNFESFLINKKYFDTLKELSTNKDIIFFIDPRFDSMQVKLYCSNYNFEQINKKLSLKEINHSDYEELRIKNTIPDFEYDSNYQKSLLLELRFDELNGISWEKGCYIGQELTARTRFRGNVKKKLFGIKIFGLIGKQRDVYYQDKIVGEIKSFKKEYGIAILKLEETLHCITKKNTMNCNKVKINPFIPEWVK